MDGGADEAVVGQGESMIPLVLEISAGVDLSAARPNGWEHCNEGGVVGESQGEFEGATSLRVWQ